MEYKIVGKILLFGKDIKVNKSAYRYIKICFISLYISFICIQSIHAQITSSLPHLEKQGTATQLIVHGKP